MLHVSHQTGGTFSDRPSNVVGDSENGFNLRLLKNRTLYLNIVHDNLTPPSLLQEKKRRGRAGESDKPTGERINSI